MLSEREREELKKQLKEHKVDVKQDVAFYTELAGAASVADPRVLL